MKFRILSILLLLYPASWLTELGAQNLPEVLQEVLRADTAYRSLVCYVNIKLDVPGLSMPHKDVEIRLEKGKKPEIKGEGITVLPRHGIVGQYKEFLEVNCQAITIKETTDTIVYKLVSLEKKTDWITVDFELTKRDAKIHSMLISTRKNGEFLVRHRYAADSEFFPEQTTISFEAMPLKLPLKFMGKPEGMDSMIDKNDPVNGEIYLRYSNIILTL